MIKYCVRCLYPDTKPDLRFDETGVCGACLSYASRTAIDWDTRKKEFLDIVEKYRNNSGDNYDCIVPVSGGKDSTYQVYRLLELGLHPLCVTATTDSLSDIGRHNIESLKRLGVDYIEVTTNPVIRRKINKFALTQVGDISWPEHVTIFTVPVRVAVQTGIKLIVWGENPQNEYGGPAAAASGNVLTRRWLEEFGGLLGMRVSDLYNLDSIKERDLIQYQYPSDQELQKVGVSGIFLGYYFPWDGLTNAFIAQAHGWKTFHNFVEGSLANYENLDNYQTGIHDYFKFIKYGFGRATDIANNHIRRGRLLRSDAVNLVKMHDGKFPWTYLSRKIDEILDEINMDLDEFIKTCDRFTNKQLFLRDASGNLVKDRYGNLTKLNYDNI